ncbi:MAG: phenylalanine--tRNA ligase subunit alpha [Armatimonadetes bacterium]|nr:phenylalanine--tRNA ligase subunit alpha [Armatimonadota bacterium]MDE2207147.1 phenylalanine--tRNA ligase subunit alpha [Armatimonadota bacterium]
MSDETLNRLEKEAVDAALAAASAADIDAVETQFLGRKGSINALRRGIAMLPSEDRPGAGAAINKAVERVQNLLAERRAALESAAATAAPARTIDVTLPGQPMNSGTLHPLTQVSQEVKAVLGGMGFEFVDGPELESHRYNFGALNYPDDHPAMDEQSTFLLDGDRVLRTQTTALQGRVMEKRRPPFRIATIGRCFRYEAVDATHHHTFHQVDVFMVDQGIGMAELKGTLAEFARAMFGAETEVRFRPDFFPFVEPGVDYSIRWGGRWLEIGGAGLIHPNILRAHHIDTEQYSGFAFGLGIERIHMIRCGVTDLRLYLENDWRFLQQFAEG